MTYSNPAASSWFVDGPSISPRTADTLPPDLMEVARKRAIAERIRDARERSKWTQPQVAEKLGLTLRGYQKVEQKGTADFERCEQLAAIFEVPGVTADYLWGEAEGPSQRSPMDDLSAPASSADLARVEQNLLGKIAEMAAELGKVQAALSALQESAPQIGRRSAANDS